MPRPRRIPLIVVAWSAIANADDGTANDNEDVKRDEHEHATHQTAAQPGTPHHELATKEAGRHDERGHRAGALAHHGEHGAGSSIAATIGVLVADYDARLFTGDYQGLVVGLRWMNGRTGLAATLPAYRLSKNGRVVDGVGDVMLHGHASILERGEISLGVMLMASAPTGDGNAGLGMGHVMLMPDAWATWSHGRIAVSGSLGAGYALGGSAAHVEHGGGGMWPLVEPMNAAEVTYGGGVMLGLARELAVGTRVRGAVPIGDGSHRVIGSVNVAWVARRVAIALEIQHGVVGDPFGLRGLVETAIRLK